jgi:hypothetical protein
MSWGVARLDLVFLLHSSLDAFLNPSFQVLFASFQSSSARATATAKHAADFPCQEAIFFNSSSSDPIEHRGKQILEHCGRMLDEWFVLLICRFCCYKKLLGLRMLPFRNSLHLQVFLYFKSWNWKSGLGQEKFNVCSWYAWSSSWSISRRSIDYGAASFGLASQTPGVVAA